MANNKQTPVIELVNLSKNFKDVHAVDDVNLQVMTGQIYGFLGPNGAGKTTTIRCIMNFIYPSSGEVRLFGQPIQTASPELYNKIGFLSSESTFYESWTGQRHIDYLAKVYGSPIESAQKLVKRLSLDTHSKVRQLSSGNKQKLAIVLALMHNPNVLILDEPTRGLDPLLQHEFYKILREAKQAGVTIFMSSHNLAEVEQICDEVGLIRQGKIVTSSSMESLRKMQTHIISVRFAEDYKTIDFNLPNIEIVHQINHELTMRVNGDFNKLLGRLAKYKLHDMDVNHASLEEIFMRYYK